MTGKLGGRPLFAMGFFTENRCLQITRQCINRTCRLRWFNPVVHCRPEDAVSHEGVYCKKGN
ncbi:hypothetical protein [Rhodobacteraceae phage LS06-2018-MD06]|nr:hypothetical protein [Rhodobacteraceae phage LS06-2018-MD06]